MASKDSSFVHKKRKFVHWKNMEGTCKWSENSNSGSICNKHLYLMHSLKREKEKQEKNES